MNFPQQKFFIILINICITFNSFNYCYALPKGFVYLNKIDSTILVSLRYGSYENFLGKPADGYKKPIVILTKQAAEALKNVQKEVKKDGYCLVIYDAYRPQQAVNHFMRWGKNIQDQQKKLYYYPRLDKSKAFELGYIAKRSGHSRGSTVDLTIIKNGKHPHAVKPINRKLLNGYTIKFLDDGTVDMGSSFDLFDTASHYENSRINQKFKNLRTYLKTVMERHGFKNYPSEWWHFTLKDEPFPKNKSCSYFNFPIK